MVFEVFMIWGFLVIRFSRGLKRKPMALIKKLRKAVIYCVYCSFITVLISTIATTNQKAYVFVIFKRVL